MSLLDAAGNAITDAEVKLTLKLDAMPSMKMPEMKESLPLARSDGQYVGRTKLSMIGLWRVSVEVIHQGRTVATYRDTNQHTVICISCSSANAVGFAKCQF